MDYRCGQKRGERKYQNVKIKKEKKKIYQNNLISKENEMEYKFSNLITI